MHRFRTTRTFTPSMPRTGIKHPQERVALKMVASSFQPPAETQATSIDEQPSQYTYHNATNYQEDHPDTFFKESVNCNIEFLKSLITLKDPVDFERGDTFPIESDDRWIIVSGEVKIVGINGISFHRKSGFLFFVSPESKKKIKGVYAQSFTSAYRLPSQLFEEHVRNLLYLKNSQKIKYMKYCPFLVWNHSLAEDLAVSLELLDSLESGQQIYKTQQESDYIYFVKEGIVLLERLGKAGNQIIKGYQSHYENTFLTEEQGMLIVRKGMIFGVDGILIKQKQNFVNRQSLNPETGDEKLFQQYKGEGKLLTTRIYNAKCVGKVELYRLQKNVLETYLKMNRSLKQSTEEKIMPKNQLNRLCQQYTNLLMGSDRVTKALKKKAFDLKVKTCEEEIVQMEGKRKKVKEIKQNEKKMKKVQKKQQSAQPKLDLIFQQFDPMPTKKSIGHQTGISYKRKSESSLPSLNKNMKLMTQKRKESRQIEKYLNYKKKVQEEILRKTVQSNYNPLQCLKVKSINNLSQTNS